MIDRFGFTLVELMVVLVILGVLAGVSVTALPSLRDANVPALSDRLTEARRTAVLTGVAVTITATRSSASSVGSSASSMETDWRFLPDGRVLGPSLDPRTGRLTDSTVFDERAP